MFFPSCNHSNIPLNGDIERLAIKARQCFHDVENVDLAMVKCQISEPSLYGNGCSLFVYQIFNDTFQFFAQMGTTPYPLNR
jgi:hypothetical protein